MLVRHTFPADGEYVFSGRLLKTVAEGLVGVEGHETPHQFIVTIDGKRVFSAPIGGKEDHEKATENKPVDREEFDKRMVSPRIKVTAGLHEVGFTFVERPTQEQNMWQPVLRSSQEAHNPSGLPRLRNGIIEGPYNPTGVSSNDVASEAVRLHAQDRRAGGALRRTRSSRRSRVARSAGQSRRPTSMRRWRSTKKSAARAVTSTLASAPASHGFSPVPTFLFRSESDPRGARLGNGASRQRARAGEPLSFFLWSSIPDDELLNLAIAGKLRAPGVLEAQVRRMIADDRADALMSAFTGQWLQLRNLDKVTPDVLLFPDFDDNVRQAMRSETELLFASIVRENRPALTLLDADYTFVNERLARHYGIPRIYGSHFRRVQVTDPNRRGLLGHGSILSMTAAANRTSPVLRGKYIISNLLNTPPLPPPAVVPDLEESAHEGSALDRSRAARTAPRQPDVRRLPSQHRSGWLRARELRRRRTVARRDQGRAGHRFGRRALRWHQDRWAVGAAQGAAVAAGCLHGDRHREAADLCPGTGARAGGHACRPEHRQGLGRAELRNAGNPAGNCEERPVPDAHQIDRYYRQAIFYPGRRQGVAMFITKKHLPRRTFLRGAMGTVLAMPFLDAMIPALSAQAAKRPFRFGAIYVPNGIYPQLWHPETTGSQLRVQADHVSRSSPTAATW